MSHNPTDPTVGIIYRRDGHPGLNSVEEMFDPERQGCFCDEQVPLSEALEREWPVDAHMLMYRIDGNEAGTEWAFARANKRSPFVTDLLSKGGRVSVHSAVFDYDLPKAADGSKAEWTQEWLAWFVQALGQPSLSNLQPTAIYTTLHGARLVYVLSRPIQHLEAEGLMLGILRDFAAAGIELDSSCHDWTRLFRLPKTVREDSGEQFAHHPFFQLHQGGPLLDPSTVTPGEVHMTQGEYAATDPYKGDKPDPDEIDDYLHSTTKKGNRVDSAWVKKARTMLAGRDSFRVIFEDQPLDLSGGWNNGLLFIVSQVVGMTARQEEASPEAIYALLFSTLQQMDAADETNETDWFETGWSMISRMWSNEEAQIAAEDNARAAAIISAEEDRDRLLDSYREARPEDVPQDEEEAREWFQKRMIASTGSRHYVMRPDGSYNINAVPDSLLISMIQDLGMSEMIPVQELRGKQWVYCSPSTLLNRYSTPISNVMCSALDEVAYFDGLRGDRTLHMPIHRLNPRTRPVYNQHVDEWLRQLGGSRHRQLTTWLAHALDVKRPICALHLPGASGAGKGMLAQGLSECFEGEMCNDGRALGKFNAGLLTSPVVWCDEGVPQIRSDETMAVDQAFRALVTGGRVTIRAMRQDPFGALMYPRILFTANDVDVIRAIIGKRDLSDDDVRAIEVRLMTLPVKEDATRFLTARGNYAFTEGWVEGDYTVANHIRWLHANRKPSSGGSGRLLVEGQVSSEEVASMRLTTEASQAILRALVQMLSSKAPTIHGMHIHDGRMWVTAAGIVQFCANSFNQIDTKLTLHRTGRVLRQFQIQDGTDGKVTPPGATRGRWYEINLPLLLEESMRYGLENTRIEELLGSQADDGPAKVAAIRAKYGC